MTSLQATFAGDVLNALTAHIAVLDADGVIVAVNNAWSRFAAANGATSATAFVGANYLSACGSAEDTTTGIRALLRGDRDEFSVEYPCDSPEERRWFMLRATRLARGAVVAHENITERKLMEEALRALSRTDSLTGVTNRRHFFELAEEEFADAALNRRPLSVILLDLDHFKRINDTRGHQAGDELLKGAAQLVRGHLRDADLFARYGGEEFIALLPRIRAADALAMAETIREDLAARLPVTMSSGIAGMLAADDTLDRLISRADRAMYAAKDAGRNRSLIFTEPSEPQPTP